MVEGQLLSDYLGFVVLLVGVAIYLVYRRGQLRGTEDTKRNLKRVQEVVNGYGGFMEKTDIGPLDVRDVSELPYPKKEIVEACLTAFHLSRDNPDYQASLKHGLMILAQFQEGVGEALKNPVDDIVKKEGPLMETMSDEEVLTIAKKISASREDSGHERRRKRFVEKVEQEQRELLSRVSGIG